MNKLTHLEATKVLTDAYRLRTEYRQSGSRLGQSIHWAANPELSSLDMSLQEKLILILDAFHATDLDFYHLTDDNRVMECFYKHYVEQGI